MTPLQSSELQVVVPAMFIRGVIYVSFMLLENIYSSGVTHDDHHLYFYRTSHSFSLDKYSHLSLFLTDNLQFFLPQNLIVVVKYQM